MTNTTRSRMSVAKGEATCWGGSSPLFYQSLSKFNHNFIYIYITSRKMKGHLKKKRTVESRRPRRAMSSDKLKELLEQQKLANQKLSEHIDAMIQTRIEETIDRVCYSIHRQTGLDKDDLVETAHRGLGQVPPSTNNTCKGVNATGKRKGHRCTHQGSWHGYCNKHKEQHPRYHELMKVGSTDAPPPPPPRPETVQTREEEEAAFREFDNYHLRHLPDC